MRDVAVKVCPVQMHTLLVHLHHAGLAPALPLLPTSHETEDMQAAGGQGNYQPWLQLLDVLPVRIPAP